MLLLAEYWILMEMAMFILSHPTVETIRSGTWSRPTMGLSIWLTLPLGGDLTQMELGMCTVDMRMMGTIKDGKDYGDQFDFEYPSI